MLPGGSSWHCRLRYLLYNACAFSPGRPDCYKNVSKSNHVYNLMVWLQIHVHGKVQVTWTLHYYCKYFLLFKNLVIGLVCVWVRSDPFLSNHMEFLNFAHDRLWCGIPDAQTKMSVSEKHFSCYKDGELNTAANIQCALLPLLTHYKGMLAHCKTGVRMAGLLF